MSQQPIVRVTTEAVKASIERYVEQHADRFTTADIARFMGVEEYSVRAAVSWLARYGMVEIIPGVRSKRYFTAPVNRRLHSDGYSVSVYRVKSQSAPVDFAALMGAFCRA
jgi:predicted transcriptional regulator of viral defense system